MNATLFLFSVSHRIGQITKLIILTQINDKLVFQSRATRDGDCGRNVCMHFYYFISSDSGPKFLNIVDTHLIFNDRVERYLSNLWELAPHGAHVVVFADKVQYSGLGGITADAAVGVQSSRAA